MSPNVPSPVGTCNVCCISDDHLHLPLASIIPHLASRKNSIVHYVRYPKHKRQVDAGKAVSDRRLDRIDCWARVAVASGDSGQPRRHPPLRCGGMFRRTRIVQGCSGLG